MEKSLRDYQFFLYVILFAVSIVVFVISANQLLFHESLLNQLSFNVGYWIYWIFALSLIFALTFIYMVFSVIKNASRFEELINSTSKSTFVKNLKELEIISKKLGKSYIIQLKTAKERWKVK